MLRTMLSPGVPASTRNIDAPRYGMLSGSVTVMTIRNEAHRAWEEKNFHPSMTHSSPSWYARHWNWPGSAPPWGSVIE